MYNVAKAKKPDLIISDFEFYSNLLNKIFRIPLVSLDNMHVITQCYVDVPEEFRADRFRAASVVKSFIQRPKYYLITSYFFPPVKNPAKVTMFPPILRDKVMELEPTIGDHILVYQTSDSNMELLKLLRQIDDEFIIYGFIKMKKMET